MLSRFPYPLEKGDKLRAFNQLKILSVKHRITLICTTESTVNLVHLKKVEEFCETIHVFKLSRIGLAGNLLLSLFSDKPFQIQYFYRSAIKRKIDRLLAEIKPDHIYCQLVRVSEYVKNYHYCPKTIDFMDALSKGMQRRIQSAPWYKSWFYNLESKRLARFERRMFDYFEHFTIISEQDRNFILHPKQKSISIVPNGVDASFFETLAVKKDVDIVFTGNFSYAPNIEAAVYLAEQILPGLKQQGFEVKLLVSGANPSSKVLELAGENIEVSGWVDDIRISYQRSHLFVAPLFIGTGLQNKLLEAMSSGLACITTPLVNNALGAKENEQIFLAENAQEFIKLIIYCIENKQTTASVSYNGQQFIHDSFSWEKQTEQLIDLLAQPH